MTIALAIDDIIMDGFAGRVGPRLVRARGAPAQQGEAQQAGGLTRAARSTCRAAARARGRHVDMTDMMMRWCLWLGRILRACVRRDSSASKTQLHLLALGLSVRAG